MKKLMTGKQAMIRLMIASSMLGTMFQLSCLNKVARNVNPCGTIIACDPIEWDLLWHDYPDWDIDPTCTIPGLCGGQWPPTGGGGGGGGGGGDAGGGVIDTTPDNTNNNNNQTDIFNNQNTNPFGF